MSRFINLKKLRHSSLSSTTSGRSKLHLVFIQSCWDVSTCWLANTGTSVCRAHWRKSLMSSSLLLLRYPARFVRLIWKGLEIRGRWPYNCCFVGCRFQDLFNIARSILVQFTSSFLSIRLVSLNVVHPYCSLE